MPVVVTPPREPDIAKVRSDTPAQAKHRAHQSAYRAEVLGLPPGPPLGNARCIYPTLGNFLPEHHDGVSADEAGWNLMSGAARAYTSARLDVIRAANGLAEPQRVWRNMLSSQPLAFSIAGELRAHDHAALSVLSRLSGLDLAKFDILESGKPDDAWALDGLQAEWAPPKHEHTGDRSGFDLAAAAQTTPGDRVLITVEVKYVDTFSPRKLDPAHYTRHLEALGITESAATELAELGASQFLRSVMLTESVRRRGLRNDGGLDTAVAVVLCRPDDTQARQVVEAVAQACTASALKIALWTHAQLFDAAADEPALHDWAQAMRRRYLI